MSDQNNNFPFEALGQEEGLDVAAIFGGAPAGNVNPFDALAAQQAETAALPQTGTPDSPYGSAAGPGSSHGDHLQSHCGGFYTEGRGEQSEGTSGKAPGFLPQEREGTH